MGWKGALVGGVIGYILGLFFKSLILVAITLKVPSLEQYLVNTFVPTGGFSNPDFLRFFTVPLPFSLLGAAVGAIIFRSKSEAMTVPVTDAKTQEN